MTFKPNIEEKTLRPSVTISKMIKMKAARITVK